MYANGSITIRIDFAELAVDGSSENDLLDALFPSGWEGELTVTASNYETEEDK